MRGDRWLLIRFGKIDLIGCEGHMYPTREVGDMGSQPFHIHTFWMWQIAELIGGNPGKHFTSGAPFLYKLLLEIINEGHSCCFIPQNNNRLVTALCQEHLTLFNFF